MNARRLESRESSPDVQNERVHQIAALMGKYPNLGMVSQFSSLNIQNLLYMQAELAELQQQLHELQVYNDRSENPNMARFSRSWVLMSSAEADEESNEQWKVALLIREKLKQYSE
jgi:hypothetical protein